MKDFYDIIVLARDFEFSGSQLAEAIRETFHRRQTPLPAERPLGLSDEFARDASKRTQWSAFIRRQAIADPPAELTDAVTLVRSFVEPVLLSVAAETEYHLNWRTEAWQP